MSFAGMLGGPDEENKKQKKPARLYRNEGAILDGQILQGQRIVAALERCYGHDYTAKHLVFLATKQNGSQPSTLSAHGRSEVGDDMALSPAPHLPMDDDGPRESKMVYGFWVRFIKEELLLTMSKRMKMKLQRALQAYAVRQHRGCQTPAGFRGMRRGGSKRSSGQNQNRTKAVGLGHQLLQFFCERFPNIAL